MDVKYFVGTHNPRPFVRVTLSRRNLLTLLAKLDEEFSLRTLVRDCEDAELMVCAEDDDVHYKERTPGTMSAETERTLAKK